jgi:catechol 2,3-dioxygenase-like lactoylglutathione lyase family enzyme
MEFSPLVPELAVSSLEASLKFWCGVVGFSIWYDRPEERFAYLTLGKAQIMLEEHGLGDRSFVNGELTYPFGRGINFQLEVPALQDVVNRCDQLGISFFLPVEDRWYRQGTVELGQRQLIVADPDGYLVRCMQSLGTRSHET